MFQVKPTQSAYSNPKAYPQIQQHDDSDFDSADELEGTVAEDNVVFQKLPDTHVKVSTNFYSGKPSPSLQDRTNAPLQGKDLYNSSEFKGRDDQDTEALKKILYNKSPKAAANEYLSTNKYYTSQSSVQTKTLKSESSPTHTKQSPHFFRGINNKENAGQREDTSNFNNSKMQEPTEISAYTELANKIYTQKFFNPSQTRKTHQNQPAQTHLLLPTEEALKIEEKRYFASKESQEDVVNRLLRQGEAMNENNRAIMDTYISKELQECTFAPNIASQKPSRTLDQFLEDQKQFQMDVEMKKQKKLEERAQSEKSKEDVFYKPQINPNSVKILEKKKAQQQDKPIYQRLYSVGKNAHTKHMKDITDREDLFNSQASMESSQFIGALNTQGEHVSGKGRRQDPKQEELPKFTPTIQKKSKNLKREAPIDSLLYSDALRRQQQKAEISKPKPKTSATAPLSMASKKALATRFIKEFDIGILEYLQTGREVKLNYLQLNQFLRKLCFLKESESIENPHFTPERLLLYDMWYTLYGDKYKGIHRRNLLVFLLAILNLHFPITKIQKHDETNNDEDIQFEGEAQSDQADRKDNTTPVTDQNRFENPVLPDEDLQNSRDRRIVGTFDADGNYELEEEDVKKINKAYNLWYINRLHSPDNIGQLINTRSYEEASYQPEINEASRYLAQNYREKMLEGTAELIQQNKIPVPKDGKITHADLLIVSKQVAKEKVNRFGELIKEEQTRSCTFKPQINQYDSATTLSNMRSADEITIEPSSTQSKKQTNISTTSSGKNRALELYALAKPRILKQDRETNEVEFEKHYQECTFQPNVVSKREQKTRAASNTDYFAKGVEKTIERLRNARAEREQQSLLKQRGFTTGTEGSFVFSIDKKKFGNASQIIDRRPERRGPLDDTSSSKYRDNSQYIHESGPNGYNYGQGMRPDDADDKQIYVYDQQEHHQGYRNGGNYRVEQEDVHQHEYEGHDEEGYDQNQQEYYQEEEEGEGEEVHEGEHEMRRDTGQEEQEEEDENGRVPLLFVDVNLGQGRSERIVVYEGDKSDELAQKFSEEHGLDPSMKGRLKELLDTQIAGLLTRIDEEMNSAHSETEGQEQHEHYENYGQIQEEDDYREEEMYKRR